MKNTDALSFFENLATNSPDDKTVKISKNGISDFSHLDAEFIARHVNYNSDILDLASGSGLILNKIYQIVGSITAVEKFQNFSKFINQSKNIQIVNSDIQEFTPKKKYDLITFFGIMQYFNEDEAISIYKKYAEFLNDDGKYIIKNQFGIHNDVLVAGFSEELQKKYFSQYRHINKEILILKQIGFNKINYYDIYPAQCNRWENTHFYAIVCGDFQKLND